MHGIKHQFLLNFSVAIYDYNRKHYIERRYEYTRVPYIIRVLIYTRVLIIINYNSMIHGG